jgi:hypothetical protein
MAGEHQTHDYYMTVGPSYPDPVGRQLYAEIASIEEQHVTQYESIIDARETWLEKWLLHEATEVYNYASCLEYETNPRIKAIWERFLDYELGQLAYVRELLERHERRDAGEILASALPPLVAYVPHRDFVREVLREESNLTAMGAGFVLRSEETAQSPSKQYRDEMNAEGSPSESVAAGYVWAPGTELSRHGPALGNGAGR